MMTELEKHMAKGAYEGGYSLPVIGERLGYTAQTLSKALKSMGVTIRIGRHSQPPLSKGQHAEGTPRKVAEFRALRKAGWTFAKIGLLYGVRRQAVQNMLARWEGVDVGPADTTPSPVDD